MHPVAKLKQDRAAEIKAANEITAKAKAASRELSAEEAAQVDKHLDAADALKAQIADAEKGEAAARERRARLAAQEEELAVLDERKTAFNAATARVESVRDIAAESANRGFKNPQDFFRAVMDASKGKADKRLAPLATAGSDEHSTFSDQFGGYLIPPGFMTEMLKVNGDADPTAGLTTKLPMGASTVFIPARTDKNHATSVTGGIRWYRRAESQAATSSRGEMEQIKLTAHTLSGLSYASEELLTDSPISIPALLQANFNEELGSTILNEKLRGTGAGQYLGVLNAPCKIEVSKETGQAADTINSLNILKMRARCWGYQRAIWLANHNCFPQLAQLSIAVGVGGSTALYQPSLVADRPDQLLGRPIFYSEYAETLGDAGDLILCDWSQFLEGQLGGMESAESIHVRFVENERAFRFNLRNDGQPWWRSALTPKKGADTLSPIVTLAAR
jgi:HK97 family phage major capsid protein